MWQTAWHHDVRSNFMRYRWQRLKVFISTVGRVAYVSPFVTRMQSGHPAVAAMETGGLCFHNSRDKKETERGRGKRRDRSHGLLLTSAQKRKTPQNIRPMRHTDEDEKISCGVRDGLHKSRAAWVEGTESAFYGVHFTPSLTTWCHLSSFNPWRKCHQSGFLAWPDVSRSIWWHTIDILAWYCIFK